MAWGGTPTCLSKASTPLQANDLPQLLSGRSKGKNICATRKPWHLLSRAGSPREPHTPQGVVASAYGRLQGRALMTWGREAAMLRHPLSSLQHSVPRFPRVRMVKAALGSRAKAPDYLCPSEDPLSFKTTPLKNTNKNSSSCFLRRCGSVPILGETT